MSSLMVSLLSRGGDEMISPACVINVSRNKAWRQVAHTAFSRCKGPLTLVMAVARNHVSETCVIYSYYFYHWHEYRLHMATHDVGRVQLCWTLKNKAVVQNAIWHPQNCKQGLRHSHNTLHMFSITPSFTARDYHTASLLRTHVAFIVLPHWTSYRLHHNSIFHSVVLSWY